VRALTGVEGAAVATGVRTGERACAGAGGACDGATVRARMVGDGYRLPNYSRLYSSYPTDGRGSHAGAGALGPKSGLEGAKRPRKPCAHRRAYRARIARLSERAKIAIRAGGGSGAGVRI
jgi:hypothetical protein